MKPFVFALGVLLMLAFSTAGMSWLASSALRLVDARRVRGLAFAVSVLCMVVLVAALAWSVPPRG
ncbi:hypothetical protein [Burkholderia gladioli]|uniref:DUF2909 domain-containing protein n=1 Tax=Burkholderia gladioli TaxID=28095 RepID=A0AB38TS70_BURGA|nr:hypothetical protein [Burkholderia gladioli]UWX70319.1 hypothetical protein NYZ96_00630 [Burkholderia gladioli]